VPVRESRPEWVTGGGPDRSKKKGLRQMAQAFEFLRCNACPALQQKTMLLDLQA